MIFILIPATDIRSYNLDDLCYLLSSIKYGHYDDVKTVVSFDACQPDFCEQINEKFPWIDGIINNGNRLNFTRNVNNGIKHILNNYNNVQGIFVVNQDCGLPKWRDLRLIMNDGLAIPCPSDTTYMKQPATLKKHTVSNKFPFFCVWINKKVIDKIGLLDGALKVVFSDDDYIARALLAGFPTEAFNIQVYHKGSYIDMTKTRESGSGAYNVVDLGLGLAPYMTKWQCPATVKHDDIIPWILENHEWSDLMKV